LGGSPPGGKVALALAAAYSIGWVYFVTVESRFLSPARPQVREGRGAEGQPSPPAQPPHPAIEP
jgi:hypothetical protein